MLRGKAPPQSEVTSVGCRCDHTSRWGTPPCSGHGALSRRVHPRFTRKRTEKAVFLSFQRLANSTVLLELRKRGAKHGVHTYADDVNPSVVSCRIRAVAPETLVNICQDNKVKESGATGSGWQNPCSTKRKEADKTNFFNEHFHVDERHYSQMANFHLFVPLAGWC